LNLPVSLQINLAPGDYRHAKYILPHQLKKLSGQVDEIILTIDTKPGKGRFAEGWDEYKGLLNAFLWDDIQKDYNVKIVPVDYSAQVKSKVAQYFFSADDMPLKDFRGGPFYAYFFGLYSAKNNLVFHLDSDMFLGGKSQTWIKEAVDFFKSDPDIFIVSPLPGPPHPGDIVRDQHIVNKIAPYTWELNGMSTRIFFIDKRKFATNKLAISKPGIRNQIKAVVQGNSNADLPEHLISTFITAHCLKRVDFLGSDGGLWSLHPPYRTDEFYRDLPALISRVNENDFPEKQMGFYDIIDEVCDWAPARERIKNNRWWKRK
jgi:hypothetical protein